MNLAIQEFGSFSVRSTYGGFTLNDLKEADQIRQMLATNKIGTTGAKKALEKEWALQKNQTLSSFAVRFDDASMAHRTIDAFGEKTVTAFKAQLSDTLTKQISPEFAKRTMATFEIFLKKPHSLTISVQSPLPISGTDLENIIEDLKSAPKKLGLTIRAND